MAKTAPSPYPTDLYAALHTGNDGDVEWYKRRCLGAKRILELGCGFGRVLASLVGPGRSIVGVDIDPEMLKLARKRIGKHRGDVRLLLGDFCDLDNVLNNSETASQNPDQAAPLPAPFDRILLPHCVLYCIDSEERVRSLLEGAARHLAPNGQILLDGWAADLFHEDCDSDVHPLGDDHSDFEWIREVVVRGAPHQVFERTSFDKDAQEIVAEYLYRRQKRANLKDKAIEVRARVTHHYWRFAQLVDLLEEAGLVVDAVFGGFDERYYGEEAEHMVVVATRAQD